jgi:hypothetical protein
MFKLISNGNSIYGCRILVFGNVLVLFESMNSAIRQRHLEVRRIKILETFIALSLLARCALAPVFATVIAFPPWIRH